MAVNTDIFLGSGASTTLVPELDLYVPIEDTGSTVTELLIHADFTGNFLLVPNLYKGCTVEIYDQSKSTTTPEFTRTIKSNTTTSITLSTGVTSTYISGLSASGADFMIIKGYGAPCVGAKDGSTIRLNADNWLGILETATFPNIEQELKQVNLALGGTRSVTHQYKGIRTASGGNLAMVSNHGAWLYYALGQCTNIATTISSGNPADYFDAGASNDVLLNTGGSSTSAYDADNHVNTGPLFYRTQRGATTLVPPVLYGTDTYTDLHQLNARPSHTVASNTLVNPITYTFAEGNTSSLPSFSLEQSIAKDPASLVTEQVTISGASNSGVTITHTASSEVTVGARVTGTDIPANTTVVSVASTTSFDLSATPTGSLSGATLTLKPEYESHNFVRVARGNRVNTLSITANEGEEIKMNMDLNTRVVDSINNLVTTEKFEARHGITDNDQLFNMENNRGTTFLEPYFFSTGKFTIFGQEFMKMSSMTLTINNNLMDKRYMGGHRDMKEGLAGQRTYELQFSAIVTDDQLFEELLNETENTGTGSAPTTSTNGLIELEFTKDNDSTAPEHIKIHLKDYFLDSTTWTIPDDKGPITVEATVKPRNLHLCTVKTHWILQG